MGTRRSALILNVSGSTFSFYGTFNPSSSSVFFLPCCLTRIFPMWVWVRCSASIARRRTALPRIASGFLLQRRCPPLPSRGEHTALHPAARFRPSSCPFSLLPSRPPPHLPSLLPSLRPLLHTSLTPSHPTHSFAPPSPSPWLCLSLLQGGAWCSDPYDCLSRSKSDYGSSSHLPPTKLMEGVFSGSREVNTGGWVVLGGYYWLVGGYYWVGGWVLLAGGWVGGWVGGRRWEKGGAMSARSSH